MTRLDAWRTGWLDHRRKRFWAWVLIAFYTLFGFVIAPPIARHVIVDQIHTQLGLTATLDDVDINPYALSARLEKFSLADPHGAKIVAFDSFTANVQLSSIFNRALTFSELTVVHPFVSIVRGEDHRLNLAVLVPRADPAVKPEPESAPLRMIIESAALEGGRVAVVDHGGRQVYQAELGPVDLKITNLSTLPNREGRQTFSMQTRFGGRLDWTGHITLEPFHSSGHMALTHERLADFSAYLPSDLLLSIVDGTLDVAFDYKMALKDDAFEADLSNLALAVKQLGLAQRADAAPSADLLRLGELAVNGGHIAWPQRSVSFERVALTQPQVSLSRDSQQRFVWETLWQSGKPAPGTPQTEPAAAADGASAAASSDVAVPAPVAAEPASPQVMPSTAPPASESPPWSVAIAKFEVADGRVGFNDQGVDPAAALGISGFAATIDGLTLADGATMPFTLNFNVDGGGTVALAGTAAAFPVVRVDAKSQLNGVGLAMVNPYLRADTYLQLASGSLSVDGHVVSNPDEVFGYDGELQLADLEVQREGESERFAGLKSLIMKGITLSTAQRKVDVARAELDTAFAKIHISKDRALNLANVTRPSAPAAAAPQVPNAPPTAAEAPWNIKLARLKVINADADFTDESLPVPFHRAISSINGGIDALDSISRSPSQVSLTGQVGEYGSLRVSGHLRALDPLGDTDVVASFKNVEMPGASPYAIRFAGHKVASGKLDLDLHYKLKKGILDGQHKIVLRDFALGEKVDYPDALDLPYNLAISLLKDSSGNIDIDLPVEGDVNDPTFRLGGVIMKALANLITKIVTAPFSLLGRLVGFGDAENFDQILFEPGVADISPPEREKVSKIADALVLRPNLALTLHGVSDPEADAEALRESSLRARLDVLVGDADANVRRKIIQKMVKESIPDLDMDALREQFKTPPTPDAKPVLDETAYLNALVQKLIDAEPLAPDAMASLAAARAAAVRVVLTENASLDAARISDGEPMQAKLSKDGAVPMKLEVKIP